MISNHYAEQYIHPRMASTTGTISFYSLEIRPILEDKRRGFYVTILGYMRVYTEEYNLKFERYVGRNMVLTFRRAYSEHDGRGAEILLGPFKIPEPEESEQAESTLPVKAAPSAPSTGR